MFQNVVVFLLDRFLIFLADFTKSLKIDGKLFRVINNNLKICSLCSLLRIFPPKEKRKEAFPFFLLSFLVLHINACDADVYICNFKTRHIFNG